MIRYFFIVLILLLSKVNNGQEHYNIAFDTSYLSARMQQNVLVKNHLYGVGLSRCQSGTCGYFMKYTKAGEVLWVREYPQIDINSGEVLHFREDKFYITAKALDTIATKTLVLDTLGNVLKEWNYSVDGAESNFSKEVVYDEDYYYFITSEVMSGFTRGALYKCDYAGNLVGRVVFPPLVFTIPLSARPYGDNIIISINHRYEEACPFGLDGISPGATYLAEVDKETMTIIRDKKDVCYPSLSSDIYISPTTELFRSVIVSDSFPVWGDGDLGFVRYDEEWEVLEIKVYPHDLAKGISNLKYTQDGKGYYTIITENVEQTDGSVWPFSEMRIQKWQSDHELIWEKRYYSHERHKRLQPRNFTIDEEGNLHIVGYVWPDFGDNRTFDFWLFSVDAEGCHNGDCRNEVNLDDLVSTNDETVQQTSITVYPNPVQDRLFIRGLVAQTPIVIWNTYGEQVYRTFYKDGNGIDMENLPAGVYFIQSGEHPAVKFVKTP